MANERGHDKPDIFIFISFYAGSDISYYSLSSYLFNNGLSCFVRIITTNKFGPTHLKKIIARRHRENGMKYTFPLYPIIDVKMTSRLEANLKYYRRNYLK